MIFSFVKRTAQKISRLVSLPELPVACPVCGTRNVVPNICRYEDKDLLCPDCEVVFSEKRPQDYKYTPQKQYRIAKKSILLRR